MFRNYNYITSILFQLVKTFLLKILTLPYDWISHKIVKKRNREELPDLSFPVLKNVIRISFCTKMFFILYLMAYHLVIIYFVMRPHKYGCQVQLYFCD